MVKSALVVVLSVSLMAAAMGDHSESSMSSGSGSMSMSGSGGPQCLDYPIYTLEGPEGKLETPYSAVEYGMALQWVNPGWHYPNWYMEYPTPMCMRFDEPGPSNPRRSGKVRHEHNREAAEDIFEQRKAALLETKSSNRRDPSSAWEKITNAISTWTGTKNDARRKMTSKMSADEQDRFQDAVDRARVAHGEERKDSDLRRAQRKHMEAGKTNARFVQKGDMAPPMEYPFMVSIRGGRNWETGCDGTLIAPGFVLTNALCLLSMDPTLLPIQGMPPMPMEVAIGGDGEDVCMEHIMVESVHFHPLLYTGKDLMDYNVVVLKLGWESSYPPVPLYEGGDIHRDCNPDLVTVGRDAAGYLRESHSFQVIQSEMCASLFGAADMDWDATMCATERSGMHGYEVFAERLFNTPPPSPSSGSGSSSGSSSGSGLPPPMEFSECVRNNGGPLLLRDENSPVGFVQVGVGYWSICDNGLLPFGFSVPELFGRVSSFTPWIYTIEGLGSPSPYAKIDITLELNLPVGVGVRIWNAAALNPLILGEPSQNYLEFMEMMDRPAFPGETHCNTENTRHITLEMGNGFVVETFVSPSISGDIEEPPFTLHWKRNMPDAGGCMVNTNDLSIKKMIRMKKTGSFFQGGLGMYKVMEQRGDGMMMPFDSVIMKMPSPKSTWACMRDWSAVDQQMCGIARGELACFVVDPYREFYYGGTNMMRELVSMDDVREGMRKSEMYALKGEMVGMDRPFPLEDIGVNFYNCNPFAFIGPFSGPPPI